MKHTNVAVLLLDVSLIMHGCGDADATQGRSAGAGPEQADAEQGPRLRTGKVSRGEIAKIINSTGTVRPIQN